MDVVFDPDPPAPDNPLCRLRNPGIKDVLREAAEQGQDVHALIQSQWRAGRVVLRTDLHEHNRRALLDGGFRLTQCIAIEWDT